MRVNISLLLLVVSFLVSGCLVDRNRVSYSNHEFNTIVKSSSIVKKVAKVNKRKVHKRKVHKITKKNRKKRLKKRLKKRKVYKPKKLHKHSKKRVKRSHKRYIVKLKKSKRRVKLYRKDKNSIEPYSFKSKGSDPELLGPQTTLKQNPLI